MPVAIDLTGQTLGRVAVLARVPGRRQYGSIVYRARCLDCGHEWEKAGSHLTAAHKAGRLGCPGCKGERIGAALSGRGVARRSAAVRRWLAGETLASIAADFGVTKQAVQQQITRGLSREQVDDMIRTLPPAHVVAVVLAMPPLARRKFLLAALTSTA